MTAQIVNIVTQNEKKSRKENRFEFKNDYNLARAGCSTTIPLSGRREARVLFIVFLSDE